MLPVMKKNQNNNPTSRVRRNYGLEDFDGEELSLIFQIVERAIVRWPLEIEEEFEVPISDLGNLKSRISKFLDEDIY